MQFIEKISSENYWTTDFCVTRSWSWLFVMSWTVDEPYQGTWIWIRPMSWTVDQPYQGTWLGLRPSQMRKTVYDVINLHLHEVISQIPFDQSFSIYCCTAMVHISTLYETFFSGGTLALHVVERFIFGGHGCQWLGNLLIVGPIKL